MVRMEFIESLEFSHDVSDLSVGTNEHGFTERN
jgi:hypothetical protein